MHKQGIPDIKKGFQENGYDHKWNDINTYRSIGGCSHGQSHHNHNQSQCEKGLFPADQDVLSEIVNEPEQCQKDQGDQQ